MTKIDRHFLLPNVVICFTLYTREIARNHLSYFVACKCVIYFRVPYLDLPASHHTIAVLLLKIWAGGQYFKSYWRLHPFSGRYSTFFLFFISFADSRDQTPFKMWYLVEKEMNIGDSSNCQPRSGKHSTTMSTEPLPRSSRSNTSVRLIQ